MMKERVVWYTMVSLPMFMLYKLVITRFLHITSEIVPITNNSTLLVWQYPDLNLLWWIIKHLVLLLTKWFLLLFFRKKPSLKWICEHYQRHSWTPGYIWFYSKGLFITKSRLKCDGFKLKFFLRCFILLFKFILMNCGQCRKWCYFLSIRNRRQNWLIFKKTDCCNLFTYERFWSNYPCIYCSL